MTWTAFGPQASNPKTRSETMELIARIGWPYRLLPLFWVSPSPRLDSFPNFALFWGCVFGVSASGTLTLQPGFGGYGDDKGLWFEGNRQVKPPQKGRTERQSSTRTVAPWPWLGYAELAGGG